MMPPPSPTLQPTGKMVSLDLYFGTNATLVLTTGAIEAIYEFPPQSWENSHAEQN